MLGATGMLGSACMEVMSHDSKIDLIGTARTASNQLLKFDARVDSIATLLEVNKPNWIINCIGVIKQKIDEIDQTSIDNTLLINRIYPYQIANAVAGSKTKVIQIATDCVFNGKAGDYSEESPHDAFDLYGKSKSRGEVVSPEFLNLLVSIIGKEIESTYSLVSWFLSQKIGAEIDGYLNHFWNGITTRTFARIVSGIILKEEFECGTFHIIPADQISKYELLKLLGKHFNRQDISIRQINAPTYVNRTLRTTSMNFNTALWRSAGYKEIPTIEELVEELANNT